MSSLMFDARQDFGGRGIARRRRDSFGAHFDGVAVGRLDVNGAIAVGDLHFAAVR